MVVGRYPTAHCAPKYAASRGGVGEYGRRSGGGREESRFMPKFTLTLHRPLWPQISSYSKQIIGKIVLAFRLFCFNTKTSQKLQKQNTQTLQLIPQVAQAQNMSIGNPGKHRHCCVTFKIEGFVWEKNLSFTLYNIERKPFT